MRQRLSGDIATAPRAVAVQGRGLVCSLLLHGLFAALVVFLFARPEAPQIPLAQFLPIDLVPLAERTPSPPRKMSIEVAKSSMRPSRVVPSSPRTPVALSRSQKRQAVDPLEIRLRKLAQLRQPDSTMPHPDNGASDAVSDNNEARGAQPSYRVRDFLRAQVERRWSLDLARAQNITVRIRVVVARDGTVTKAEIVDRGRYASDAAWRAVALSARNAVLLSSPLSLPASAAGAPLDVTLALNPKDASR
ncbi:MAG TPA: hypothetical protein VGL35_02010 [Rhizomicrobium sp.]|jgi:hypothetical protein